jgi:hypothetical protein
MGGLPVRGMCREYRHKESLVNPLTKGTSQAHTKCMSTDASHQSTTETALVQESYEAWCALDAKERIALRDEVYRELVLGEVG